MASRKSIHTRRYRKFADELKRARLVAGLTQVELAESLGVTQTFISKCERGERRVDIVELVDWCRCLRLEASVFIAAFEAQI